MVTYFKHYITKPKGCQIAKIWQIPKILMGVDVVWWRPWSSKSVGGCEQQAPVGSTPIRSRSLIKPGLTPGFCFWTGY
jgi:hypothetical protein